MNLSMVIGVAHQISACLIKGYRVKRRKNAYIVHLGVGGMRIAVAINREIVGHAYIYNIISTMVGYSLCSLSHRFEKIILLSNVVPEACRSIESAGRMDIALTVGRCDAD